MTGQAEMFSNQSAQGGAPLGISWDAWGHKPGRHYALQIDGDRVGVEVHHCGHPTANWPYYITAHWQDEIIVADNGRGFQLLEDAKQRAVQLYLDRKKMLTSDKTASIVESPTNNPERLQ